MSIAAGNTANTLTVLVRETNLMQDIDLLGFALSPQQRRLACALDPQGAGEPYVAQIAVVIEGPLDPVRFQQALDSIIRRYEILRTRFVRRPGLNEPLQIILPEQAVSPELFNLAFVGRNGHDDGDQQALTPCAE